MRYDPAGTVTEKSATEMIEAARKILRAISESPGLEVFPRAKIIAHENRYVRLIDAEIVLSQEHGPFSLFAVFHRKGGYEKSADVVVAAPWIDAHSRGGIDHVVKEMHRVLPGDEINVIAGVVAVGHTEPFVQKFHAIGTEHMANRMSNVWFGNVHVDEALLITRGGYLFESRGYSTRHYHP